MSDKVYGRKIIRSGKRNPIKIESKVDFFVVMIIGIIVGMTLLWFIQCIRNVYKEGQKEDPVVLEEGMETYGTADGRYITSEIRWTGAEVPKDFIPLDVDMKEDLQEYTYCLCTAYNIDWTLVMALIEQESGFNEKAFSVTGDYGLMQINEGNLKYLQDTLGIDDFLDGKQNIRAGVFILRNLFEKYEDPSQVLMAYNMGEGSAKKLWDMGIYESNYSISVLEKQEKYLKGEGNG